MDILNTICNYPHTLVMGGASLVGALAYAGYSVARKKVEDKKFKFDWSKITDTVWQSTAAGAVAGLAIGCSVTGLIIAMVTGIGIDRIANKIKINEKQILNFVGLFVKMLEKKK